MRRLATTTALGCFFLAAAVLPCRAGDTANTSSNIKASLKLAPDFHEITLDVTNNGGSPLTIDEYHMGVIDTYFDRKAKVPDDTPVAITGITELHLTMVCLANPAYPPPLIWGTGCSYTAIIPDPVTPGTTRKTKYPLNSFPDVQKYSKVEFLVFSGDKVLAKLVLESDGKNWKQK